MLACRLHMLFAAIAFAFLALAVHAQSARPIRIVVPFPPGASPNDVIARIVGPKLAEQMKQPVVIDNRPGAAGTIGTDIVAKSNPDGHTLVINSTTLTVVPNAYRNLPFDPYQDLAPITLVAQAPQLVMVNMTVPASTLKSSSLT